MNLSPLTLENEFVCLEPMAEGHRELLRPLAETPGLWSLMTMRGDGPHFDSWFDFQLKGQAEGTQISHVVTRKSTNTVVGHSAYLMIAPIHARAEIGWTWYSPEARGTEVNPASKRLLLERLFACGAERAELKTHGLNKHSQAAMRKLGAVYEGTLRHHTRTWRGDLRDTVWFSILKGEWPKVRDDLDDRLAAFRASL